MIWQVRCGLPAAPSPVCLCISHKTVKISSPRFNQKNKPQTSNKKGFGDAKKKIKLGGGPRESAQPSAPPGNGLPESRVPLFPLCMGSPQPLEPAIWPPSLPPPTLPHCPPP